MDLDKFFDGFTIIFVPALICFLAGGMMCITWVVVSFFEKIVAGFKMQKQLQGMKLAAPSDPETRAFVLRMRTRSDSARLARMKKRRDDAARALTVDLPDGLPADVKDAGRTDTGEIDVTAEVFREEARYLVCTNPLGDVPKYFHSILKGRGVEKGNGVRDARFHFTQIRSMARRMTKTECTALIPHLPGAGRGVFIVSAEPDASERALADLRTRLKNSVEVQTKEIIDRVLEETDFKLSLRASAVRAHDTQK